MPLPFSRIPYELNSRLKMSARPARVNELSASPKPACFFGPSKKTKIFQAFLPCAVPTRTLHTPKPIVPTRTLSNQARSNPTSTITPQATEGSNFEAPLWTDSTPKKGPWRSFLIFIDSHRQSRLSLADAQGDKKKTKEYLLSWSMGRVLRCLQLDSVFLGKAVLQRLMVGGKKIIGTDVAVFMRGLWFLGAVESVGKANV